MRKVLKIVLGIVWLLLTVFLLAGLIFPQVKYQAKTSVNLPLDKTFTLFNDITQIQKWIPEIKSISPIEETPNQIGSRYKIVMDNQGTETEMIEKVIDYQTNKGLTLEFDAGSMIKTDQYSFTEQDGKTIITHDATAKGNSYLNRCFFAFLKGAFKKIDQKYLDNFKAFAES